jgi:hypothetical protein
MSFHRSQHRQHTGAISCFLLVFMLASGQTNSGFAAAIPAPALNAQQPGTALVFYGPKMSPKVSPGVSNDLWPVLFQTLRSDLADGAGDLPEGLVLDKDPLLVRGDQDLRGMTFPQVITVKLLGRCDVYSQAKQSSEKGPLGWVLLVSGKVQPFVSIDCARIAEVLRPTIAGWNKQRRQDAMVQAITHVLIHEWSHIATQSSAHSSRGITQANLSVSDLIKEPLNSHFSARMH